jgi:hypothetical protein
MPFPKERTMKKRTRRQKEMEKWLGIREKEGISFRELSSRSGFPIGTLSSLSRKIRLEQNPELGFCELKVVEAPKVAPSSVTVRFPSGHELIVDGEIDPASLERLTRALLSAC